MINWLILTYLTEFIFNCLWHIEWRNQEHNWFFYLITSGTNVIGASSYADFASKLKQPRRAMLMVKTLLSCRLDNFFLWFANSLLIDLLHISYFAKWNSYIPRSGESWQTGGWFHRTTSTSFGTGRYYYRRGQFGISRHQQKMRIFGLER